MRAFHYWIKKNQTIKMYIHNLLLVLVFIVVAATVHAKMNTIPTAELVSQLNTVQVDMEAIQRLVAEKMAKDEIKKSDELHANEKQHQREIQALRVKFEKEKTADEIKRARAAWSVQNPGAADYEYQQERQLLRDEVERKILVEESAKRMKIFADEQAAKDYAITHAARTQANKHVVAGIGYALIGCGVGFLVLHSNM